MRETKRNALNLLKIHHLIELQAKKEPAKTAIICNDQKVTYGEINAKSNQLARYLIANGVDFGDIVPIVSVKSSKILIAILGILKAGAAYSPLNFDSPEKHIKAVIKETKASIFCIDGDLIDQFTLGDVLAINLDDMDKQVGLYSEENLDRVNKESDLAYVIYTSGTTGNPKGGMVAHANLLPTYYSWEETYKLASTDIHLQMAPVGFDVFAGDWVRALCSGATLVLCPKNILLDHEKLYQLIKKEKITCAEFVPSTLRGLLNFVVKNNYDLKQFRLLICGSDQWTMKEYRLVRKLCAEEAFVISSYGVTETTIDSTFYYEKASEEPLLSDSAIVPIGKPFHHVNIYLVDDDNNLLNTDDTGEICIGGSGVGLGYLGQPELTYNKFIERNFKGVIERLYRTGDQGKILPDGNILFLGRNQEHVKVDGKRVDLPSLESSISQHPKVKFCMVIPTAKANSYGFFLKCFVKLQDDSLTFEEISDHVRKEFPCYYVPREIYEVDKIPLSANGKIDKRIASQEIVKQIKPNVVTPNNVIQEYLISVWQEILDVQEIGINNSFYDLGGSSLLLVSVLEKINQKFNINILPSEKFETIEELSNSIMNEQALQEKRNEATANREPANEKCMNQTLRPPLPCDSALPGDQRKFSTASLLYNRNQLPQQLPRRNFYTFFKPPLHNYPAPCQLSNIAKKILPLVFKR